MVNSNFHNNNTAHEWQSANADLSQYQHSGWDLIGKVWLGERAVHIGCGNNPFQEHIANFHGIDTVGDVNTHLEAFIRADNAIKFNVAFCLDPQVEHTAAYMERYIALVKRLLRERDCRIYWRVSGDYWTEAEILRLAGMFNFTVAAVEQDTNNKLFMEWVSKNTSRYM